MRSVLEEYGDRLLIGELYLPVDRLVTYYGEDNSGVHLPFNFHLISTPWNAREISTLIDAYEAALPQDGWPTWVLGNHDRSRIASRVGDAQARVAAMLLLTLRGTPTLYYGDELGMRDVEIPPERVQDPFEKNVPGLGLGRDPARTPMQWDASPNAGFCAPDVEPWLPVADDYRIYNAATEREDPASMLNLHRRLLALRRSEPALALGSYDPVEATGDVLAYARETDGRRLLIVLNLGHDPATFKGRRSRAGWRSRPTSTATASGWKEGSWLARRRGRDRRAGLIGFLPARLRRCLWPSLAVEPRTTSRVGRGLGTARLFAAQLRDEHAAGNEALLYVGLVDGGEGRFGARGLGHVVEAHHREVLGYGEPHPFSRPRRRRGRAGRSGPGSPWDEAPARAAPRPQSYPAPACSPRPRRRARLPRQSPASSTAAA